MRTFLPVRPHCVLLPTAQGCGGFTLIEGMVVVAIVAILAALAAPSFRDIIANQRVKGVSADLQMALVKARSEATKRNVSVTLSPKAGNWASGWQILNPADASLLDDHGTNPGVTISGPGSIIYQGSGRVQGGSEVELEIRATTLDTAVHCISIDPSGRPKIRGESC